MKFINTRPVPKIQAPAIITHFGPNLSESQPVMANIRPLHNVPVPTATDAAARLKPSSAAMGLKSTEIEEWNPIAKPVRKLVTRFIHQPKYIFGKLLRLIKGPLS